jgi:hypothetical protein
VAYAVVLLVGYGGYFLVYDDLFQNTGDIFPSLKSGFKYGFSVCLLKR